MRIDIVGIPTVNRPASLRRCVTSYVENALEYGRMPTLIVCDDGRTTLDRLRCDELLGTIGRRYGISTRYIGLKEKLTFVKHLSDTRAVSPDVLKFAFFDSEQVGTTTHGANRNSLLALTHGHSVLTVDDDTICKTHVPMGHSRRIVIRPADDAFDADPAELWPLASEERDSVCRAQTRDCIGEHEQWLGRSLEECCESFAQCPPAAGNLANSRVTFTVNGLIGDCGWGSPTPYLFVRGSSRERLMTATNQEYDAFTTSRQVMRSVRSLTVCERVDFMSTFFAMDNSRTLPPFSPVCRGADRVFSTLADKCCADSASAHLPVILMHEPERSRRFWRGEISRSSAGIDMSTLFCTLIHTVPGLNGHSSAARLATCGRHLQDIASYGKADFVAFAATSVRKHIERQMEYLESLLATTSGRSGNFRRDTSVYLSALQVTSARPDVYVPLDIRFSRSGDDAAALTQRLIHRFGRLLNNWPAILELSLNYPARLAEDINA